MERPALEATALMREHDTRYFVELHEELTPHIKGNIRAWEKGLKRAAEAMGADDVEQKIAERTQIVAIADELLELWHDEDDQAWAYEKARGPGCCWRLASSEIKRFLIKAYGECYPIEINGRKVLRAPGRYAVSEALDQVEAMALLAPQSSRPVARGGCLEQTFAMCDSWTPTMRPLRAGYKGRQRIELHRRHATEARSTASNNRFARPDRRRHSTYTLPPHWGTAA